MRVWITRHALDRFTERVPGASDWPHRRLRPVYAAAVRDGLPIDQCRGVVLVLVSIRARDVVDGAEGMVHAVARCRDGRRGDRRVITTTTDARWLSAPGAREVCGG